MRSRGASRQFRGRRALAAVVAITAVVTSVVIAFATSSVAGPSRSPHRYSDYLPGTSGGSDQCEGAPVDRQGGWTCYTPSP